MIHNTKQYIDTQYFININNHKKNFKHFLKFLRFSRIPFLKQNGLFLALFQYSAIDAIAFTQEEITKLNKEKKTAVESNVNTEKIDRQIFVNKELLRIIFTIVDGIAVRSFRFNRPVLRLMSENNNPGHLVKDSQDHPALLKQLLSHFRHIRIINDITRFLRIGDVTNIYKDGKIVIYEAKTDVKTQKTRIISVGKIFDELIRNRNIPNRQNQRLLNVQMSIINNRISIPERVGSVDEKYKEKVGVDILDLDFPIKNHLKKVNQLLTLSNKSIIQTYTLEDGYIINILSCDKLTLKNQLIYLDKLKDLVPNWSSKIDGTTFEVSNYDTFFHEDGEFTRNILPYSVYPFSSKNCLRLITGDVYIIIYFDSSFLKKKLQDNGWSVENGDFFDIIQSKEPFKKTLRDNNNMYSTKEPVVFKLSKETSYGTYTSSILGTQVLNMMFSFYSTDFLMDSVNKQFEISKPGVNRFATHNYLDEKNIFI